MVKGGRDGRARDPVKRTGKKFRVKFPSKKLGRMVQCESILERDAALLLESNPVVAKYQEQPERIIFHDGERLREYFPDFRAETMAEQAVDIEVKRARALAHPETRRKLQSVAKAYAARGKKFRIWTDEWIRQEPRFSRIKQLLQALRGRTRSAELEEVGQNPHQPSDSKELRARFEKALNDPTFDWLKDFGGENDASLRI